MALDSRKSTLKIGSGMTRGSGLVNRTSLLGLRTSNPSSNYLPPVSPSKSKVLPAAESTNTTAVTYFEVDANNTSYFLDDYYES